MPKFLTPGDRFGRSVVLDPDVGRDEIWNVMVRLLCDPVAGGCGMIYQTTAANLRSGNVQSCGCLRARASGTSSHPLYNTWHHMIGRCENPRHRQYAGYGGRGITVWGPWHDPARFIADVEAEIGPRPEGRYPSGRVIWTLNRIDNNGGYRPGNIEWADGFQQARNRRARAKKTSPVVTLTGIDCPGSVLSLIDNEIPAKGRTRDDHPHQPRREG